MLEEERDLLAAYLQAELHEYLPGYYFSPEQVREAIDGFYVEEAE